MATNAGRILILARGAWNNNTNYTMLDLVTHGNLAYLARQASIGVDPSTDTTYSYWQPFGSAAQIATTTTPGLVMPDGVTITVDNTGLIQAVLGVEDLSNVDITSLADGQMLRYDSNTTKWVNVSLGTASAKDSTNAVTQSSTDLVESGAVYDAVDAVNDALTDYEAEAALYLTGVACSATTGNFASVSNAKITADHVVVACVWSKPVAITTDVTWTTASGSLTLNGTCTDATCTVNITLVKKGN